MARNPLFGVFSRALRTATLANRRSMPINELSELAQCRRKQGLKRRQFLKTAGAFGGGMLLSVGSSHIHSPLFAQTSTKLSELSTRILADC